MWLAGVSFLRINSSLKKLSNIKWLLDDVALALAYFNKICLNLILRIRLQESLASLIYSLVGNYLHFLQLVLL